MGVIVGMGVGGLRVAVEESGGLGVFVEGSREAGVAVEVGVLVVVGEGIGVADGGSGVLVGVLVGDCVGDGEGVGVEAAATIILVWAGVN